MMRWRRGVRGVRFRVARLWAQDVAEEVGPDEVARFSFYHDVARSRLSAQDQYNAAIDNKSTSFFTIGSTILPIVGGFLATDNGAVVDSALSKFGLVVGSVSYLILAACYLLSFRQSKWANSPDMLQLKDLFDTENPQKLEDIQKALGDSYVEAYLFNEPRIEKKAKRSAFAMWSLGAEVIGLGIAVLAPFVPSMMALTSWLTPESGSDDVSALYLLGKLVSTVVVKVLAAPKG